MNYLVFEYEQRCLRNQRGQKGFEIMGCDLNFLRKAFLKCLLSLDLLKNETINEMKF